MAMIDMKRSKSEHKKEMEPTKMHGDDYPYGLSIRLDHHSLKKLGMHEGKMPKIGDKLKIHAHAHVVSASEHSEEGGEPRRHLELQLRKMDVGKGENLEKPSGDTEEGMKKGAKAAMDKVLGPKEEGSESADGDEA